MADGYSCLHRFKDVYQSRSDSSMADGYFHRITSLTGIIRSDSSMADGYHSPALILLSVLRSDSSMADGYMANYEQDSKIISRSDSSMADGYQVLLPALAPGWIVQIPLWPMATRLRTWPGTCRHCSDSSMADGYYENEKIVDSSIRVQIPLWPMAT